MIDLSEKEKMMLAHYRALIQDNTFDEYDILGFLIFIRRHIRHNEKMAYIEEFTDLIAHRERDRGIIVNSIRNAKANAYNTEAGTKTVIGYHGLKMDRWIKEWEGLEEACSISFSSTTMHEISLCICSLCQGTHYKFGDNQVGKIELIQSNDDCLGLVTSEGLPNSLYICFFNLFL